MRKSLFQRTFSKSKGGMGISDQKYIEYLIESYGNLILSICYQMTQNYFDAEDLTQETFLAAYKNLKSFDYKYEKAWLARIAVNKCIDYKRKNCNLEEPTDESIFHTMENGSSEIDAHLLDEEVQNRLKKCCEQLKSPYKEVALAHFYEEKGVDEIAAKTGKGKKTIQTQIYRAKEQLRKLYRREEERQ